MLRFNPLSDTDIKKYVLNICKKENVQYENSGIDRLVFVAEGDMRNVINNLQAIHNAQKAVTEESVYEICDVPNTQKLEALFD